MDEPASNPQDEQPSYEPPQGVDLGPVGALTLAPTTGSVLPPPL
jgi:hypothetical protein